MKRSKNELLEQIKKIIGENETDDYIQLLEDITDTVDEGQNDWEEKYNAELRAHKETEDNWKKKYTDRFFKGEPNPHKDDKINKEEEEEKEEKTADELIADLFIEKEGV